jgi:hypothetical protein
MRTRQRRHRDARRHGAGGVSRALRAGRRRPVPFAAYASTLSRKAAGVVLETVPEEAS